MIELSNQQEKQKLLTEAISFFNDRESRINKNVKTIIDSYKDITDNQLKHLKSLITFEQYDLLTQVIKGSSLLQQYTLKDCDSKCLYYLHEHFEFTSIKCVEMLINRLLDLNYTDFIKYYDYPDHNIRKTIILALYSKQNFDDLEYFTDDHDEELRNLATLLLQSRE